jgi:hypothetical protein
LGNLRNGRAGNSLKDKATGGVRRTENPRVGGSIPPLATKESKHLLLLRSVMQIPSREFAGGYETVSLRKITNPGFSTFTSHTLSGARMSCESSAAE